MDWHMGEVHHRAESAPLRGSANGLGAAGACGRAVGSRVPRWRHAVDQGVGRLNYARCQQYRRLSRAAMAGIASGATVLLALEVASAGAVSAAGTLLVLAVGLGLYARHWLLLADRSRIGARSEDEVRRALAPLMRWGGGCGTRSRGEAGGTLTPWPLRRPGSRSRSRRRRGATSTVRRRSS